MAHQIITVQVQQLRIAFFCLSAPGIKAGTVHHIGRNTRIVKRFNECIVHQHILASLLMLQLLDVFNQLLIVFIERPAIHPGLVNLPSDQPFADKNLA